MYIKPRETRKKIGKMLLQLWRNSVGLAILYAIHLIFCNSFHPLFSRPVVGREAPHLKAYPVKTLLDRLERRGGGDFGGNPWRQHTPEARAAGLTR